jgi:hypothetical protein
VLASSTFPVIKHLVESPNLDVVIAAELVVSVLYVLMVQATKKQAKSKKDICFIA